MGHPDSHEIFFVIRGLTLTGQQGGVVNLRLLVSTWLRPADVPSGLPPTPEAGVTQTGPSAANPVAQGKEGE